MTGFDVDGLRDYRPRLWQPKKLSLWMRWLNAWHGWKG